MVPVVAIVGRPNVGKSTLFNCLTKTRNALVADKPGLTRDRNYGEFKVNEQTCIVIDTGGLTGHKDDLEGLMADQVWVAVDEADILLFLVDARAGLLSDDFELTKRLRRSGKPIVLVINKIDGIDETVVATEFSQLGLDKTHQISASHNRGVPSLVKLIEHELPDNFDAQVELPEGIRVAVVGRPNVGKSTLINRLLGYERVVTFDMPGTTRDSIFIPFEKDGKDYVLIDTAGVRRKSKVSDKLEKFSVIKSLKAIEQSHVVVLVLDAQQEISDQDAHLLGFVIEAGRALVIAVNKWDGLDEHQKSTIKDAITRKLQFVSFAKIIFISALHGTGVGLLYKPILKAYQSTTVALPTPKLTQLLEQAVANHQPQLVNGRRIKLRYAHQGGRNPPVLVIHGNQTKKVPENYRRYLENYFRQALQLEGTQIRIEFKTGVNPYNITGDLTPRQIARKSRIKKFAKKKK